MRVFFFWSKPLLPAKLKTPQYTVLYALSMPLRDTATGGRWRQAINNFLSERSRDGSLTVQI